MKKLTKDYLETKDTEELSDILDELLLLVVIMILLSV